MNRTRLWAALAAYAMLAVAGLSVDHREMRLMLWIALAGLAVKSWVGFMKEQQHRPD